MKRRLVPLAWVIVGLSLLAQRNQPAIMPDTSQLDDLVQQNNHAAAVRLLHDCLLYDEQTANWQLYAEHTDLLCESLDQLGKSAQMDSVLQRSIRRLQTAGWADSAYMSYLWLWKALNTRRLENYTDALEHYREAIRLFEIRGKTGYYPAYCYKNAAQILIRRMDYKSANEYLEAALRSDTDGDMTQSILTQISNNYFWQDSLDAAWKYYLKGLGAPSQGAFYEASLYGIGATIQLKKNNLDQAHKLALKSLEGYKKTAEKLYYVRCYTDLAQIASLSGQPARAERWYREAESTALAVYQSKSREIAKLYTEWGDFCAQNGQRSRALQLYQQALVQAWPGFDDRNPQVNPPNGEPPVELWAMRALARKGQLLLHAPTPDASTREVAADCFDRALDVAEALRRTYGKDEAKLYFQQRNFNVQQEAARNLWALAQSRPDKRAVFLARFFTLVENSRAAVLRDALAQQRALVLTGVPDSLLQLEDNLRRDAAAQQKSVEETSDPVQRAAIQAGFFQTNRRYADLIASIARQYPQFDRYNQAGKVAAPETVQTALPDSAVLLSFFDTGDRYLCLSLRKSSGLQAWEVAKDSSLQLGLNAYLSMLSDKNAQENAPDSLFALAYFLKEKLLPEAALNGAQSLIVIPDGPLCYLPFEALLTAPHRGSFGQAPWLIRRADVRYAWSASLTNGGGASAKGLLHIAPFVREGRDGLAPLASSAGDVPPDLARERIVEQSATAAAFEAKAPAYGVLHLSTHANGGENPGVEFADRRMTLSEIYAQRYRADLVSLSACETNTGLLAQGEGVLSLARAFAYAGAQSLVASYWKVSDRSTASLFAAFYNYLQGGKSRSEALQRAKLAYLDSKEPDSRKSPWHWAAFTLTGADGPVELGGSGVSWKLAFALIMLVAALGIWLRRRKMKMA